MLGAEKVLDLGLAFGVAENHIKGHPKVKNKGLLALFLTQKKKKVAAGEYYTRGGRRQEGSCFTPLAHHYQPSRHCQRLLYIMSISRKTVKDFFFFFNFVFIDLLLQSFVVSVEMIDAKLILKCFYNIFASLSKDCISILLPRLLAFLVDWLHMLLQSFLFLWTNLC